MKYQRLVIIYLVCSFALFLYSYTQVDLNLTLSRASILQTIQKAFQYLGYYQRPLSTIIYLLILGLLFTAYGWLLCLIKQNLIRHQGLWRLIFLVTGILVLSYPAFSYDFFNYMFTAKTVLVYHKNPYLVIPQQFWAIDPWVNFMRWIHLPSAYTPLWIGLTLLPYLLGFGYFLLIMWNIKLLVAGFYLLTVWGLEKVLEKTNPQQKTLGLAIFALNPLIIIESLVSGHNDIVMMALVAWSIYFFLEKKKWLSVLVWAFSVAAKLMTVFILPVFLLASKKTVNWRVWSLVAMMIGFTLVCLQREVLPWYWVWIMPFIALLPAKHQLTKLAAAVSLGLLLRYAPYLYYGHWDNPVPLMKIYLTWIPIIFCIIYLIIKSRVIKRHEI